MVVVIVVVYDHCGLCLLDIGRNQYSRYKCLHGQMLVKVQLMANVRTHCMYEMCSAFGYTILQNNKILTLAVVRQEEDIKRSALNLSSLRCNYSLSYLLQIHTFWN